MEFQLGDITHGKLTRNDFYKKYARYKKDGILIDTAPLFVLLIGKLSIEEKGTILKELNYTEKDFETLDNFLKILGIKLKHIILTPQILQELISHFQNGLESVKNKTPVLSTFIESLKLLKEKHQWLDTWEVMTDSRMSFIDLADISLLIYARDKKSISLLTQDEPLLQEAAKHKNVNYENILAIDFQKILNNADQIPTLEMWSLQ